MVEVFLQFCFVFRHPHSAIQILTTFNHIFLYYIVDMCELTLHTGWTIQYVSLIHQGKSQRKCLGMGTAFQRHIQQVIG